MPVPDSTGQVVNQRRFSKYQLAGVTGSISGASCFSTRAVRLPCPGVYRQYCDKGAHKSPGGHQIQVPYARSKESGTLGGPSSLFFESGSHLQGLRCAGGLTEVTGDRPLGVAPAPSNFQGPCNPFWHPGGRLVCDSCERSTSAILLALPSTSGGSSG